MENQKNLDALWKTIQTNAKRAIDAKKEYEPVNMGDIVGIVKGDNDPILLQVPVMTKAEDGVKSEQMYLLLTQDGDAAIGDGKGNVVKDENGNTETPDSEEPENTIGDKGDIETRLSKVENALRKQGVRLESTSDTWNFNNEQYTTKQGLERLTIKRFFNEMNDPCVKSIKFVGVDGKVKEYSTDAGSNAYSEFKKDFRESTQNAVGKKSEYRVVFESGFKSRLSGFKFSDFGMDDDFDSDSKTIVIRESIVKPVAPNDDDDHKKTLTTESTVETIMAKDPEPNGFTLELDEIDPTE